MPPKHPITCWFCLLFYFFWFQALEVARQVTGQNDNHTAKVEFLKMMNSSEMFFSNGSIPGHESDKNAFKLCSSAEKAKEHCPQRWLAIQRWFTETREVTAGEGLVACLMGMWNAIMAAQGWLLCWAVLLSSNSRRPITIRWIWSSYPVVY